MNTRKSFYSRGFSIIELLIIVAVIALLAAIFIPWTVKADTVNSGYDPLPAMANHERPVPSEDYGLSLSEQVHRQITRIAARPVEYAQSATIPSVPPPVAPVDVSTEIIKLPQSSVSNATFMVSIGFVQNNNSTAAGNLENRLEVGYVLPLANRDFFVFGAIENAPTSGILDLEGAGFGFRKVLTGNSEIYAKIGGEHSSKSKAWDAAFAVGLSYAPGAASGTMLLAGSLFAEEWAVHSFGGLTPDYLRTVAGYRLNF